MSSFKKDRDGDEEEPLLDISSTAAKTIEDEADRERVFNVIQSIHRILGHCNHKVLEKIETWPRKIILRFYRIPACITLSNLEDIVREGGGWIMDLMVSWKQEIFIDTIISTPGRTEKEALFPIHVQQFYRETEFKKAATSALAIKSPPSWKEDVKSLDSVVTLIYNSEEILDYVTCDMEILHSDKRYCLKFQNLNRITYSFLEYLMTEGRNRIHDITLQTDGLSIYVRSHEDGRPARKIETRQNVSYAERGGVPRPLKPQTHEKRE